MHRHVRFGTGFLTLGVGLLVALGCGGGVPTAKVTGTATLDGKPIPFGIISFNPTEVVGSPRQSYIKEGSYTIPDINYGKYKVHLTAEAEAPAGINTDAPPGQASSDMMMKGKGGGGKQGGMSTAEAATKGGRGAKRARSTADDPNPIENAMRRAKGVPDNIMPLNAEGNDKEVNVMEKEQTIDFTITTPGKKK